MGTELSSRWCTVIRKSLSPKTTPSMTDVEPENKETDEEKKLNETEEMANALDQKNKRAKSLLLKEKQRLKRKGTAAAEGVNDE